MTIDKSIQSVLPIIGLEPDSRFEQSTLSGDPVVMTTLAVGYDEMLLWNTRASPHGVHNPHRRSRPSIPKNPYNLTPRCGC
jgi:hypothetical protein